MPGRAFAAARGQAEYVPPILPCPILFLAVPRQESRALLSVRRRSDPPTFSLYTRSVQEYLIKVGNLSLGAVQMIGDLLNTDAGYYEAFVETLRGIISFFQEPRWEVG